VDRRGLRGGWQTFQRYGYAEPAPDLAPHVERYWFARWNLRGQPPYRQLIVPYPNVHLTWVNDEPAKVHGVSRGHVFRVLEGDGHVSGVAFRPGAFRPFLRRAVSTITGRSVDARSVFGPDVPRDVDNEAMETFLRGHLPPRDPTAEEVAGIVARIAADPKLTRVDELATLLGVGIRRLQRLFAEYVGVGPKWVIRRYRLHEVTERLAANQPVDWARLAAELGYADQAHFSRDFTAMFSEAPSCYAERYGPLS
jgi:AraC-like DNA-binding protein